MTKLLGTLGRPMTALGVAWEIAAGVLLLLVLVALVASLVPHKVRCVRCQGHGTVLQRAHPMNRRVPCPICDGTGWQAIKP